MADAIDELYAVHTASAKQVHVSLFRCTNGYTLTPRLALSGSVEHVCGRCDQIIEVQSLATYLRLQGRNSIVVTCPRVTETKTRRRRLWGRGG